MRLQHRQQHLLAAAICTCVLTAFVQHAASASNPGTAPAPASSRYELINTRPGNVLCLILTDCAKYQDWQTIAAAFAWRVSGQPGSMVRVANCNEEDTKKYDKKMLAYVKTHMAPQVHPQQAVQLNLLMADEAARVLCQAVAVVSNGGKCQPCRRCTTAGVLQHTINTSGSC